MGAKKAPFYRVVVADSRYPRDGRFIEEIGTYNPLTEPATVNIDAEKAKKWIGNGAQPTDTVRNILSNEGVYLMKHLKGGVKKGAFTEEEAQKKFQAWKDAKVKGTEAAKAVVADAKKKAAAAALEAEKKVNEAIAKKVAEKKAAAEAAKAEAEAAPAEEATEAAAE